MFAIQEDDNGKIWVCTEGGVSIYAEGQFTNLTTADGLVHNRVYKMLQDRQGQFWFGTEAGISCYNGENFRNYTKADGMKDDDVNALIEDAENNIWIGTEDGLVRFDGDTFKNFGTSDGLAGQQIMGMAIDREGKLWIATLGGVSCYDGEEFVNYTSEQGLSSDTVLRVFEDRAGYLWFGTWAGINRFDGVVFQSLTKEDGLTGSTLMAIYQDSEDRIWLGSSSGVTCFQPPAPSPPPIYIRSVVADRRYKAGGQLQIPASSELTAFEFHCVNFKTRPGAMVYGYRLEGLDSDWQVTHARRVEYEGLRPGTYTFQVTAVDRDLNYSMPAKIEVEIVPDARDEKIDELEERVRERTKELREKNKTLEQTLRQSRSTQNQLVTQEKMAALGNLVAGIVHELNNPLSAVKSSGDVVARGLSRIRRAVDGSGDLSGVLQLLDDSARAGDEAVDRMTRILGNLKNFTRLDEAEYQMADLHEGIESTLALLEHSLDEDVKVDCQFGELPKIYCNPAELNQVFMNVLLNASQAIEGEGVIGVKTGADEKEVFVIISDTGRGIEKERLDRIFDPDFSNKDSRVRLGLGLAMSYNIIGKHRGTFRLESEPGSGTVATITLPIDRVDG